MQLTKEKNQTNLFSHREKCAKRLESIKELLDIVDINHRSHKKITRPIYAGKSKQIVNYRFGTFLPSSEANAKRYTIDAICDIKFFIENPKLTDSIESLPSSSSHMIDKIPISSHL